MKRYVLLAAFVLLIAAPAVQAASKSPFTGPWRATDTPGDGSAMGLQISGGSKVQLTFIDHYGTICFNNSAPTNVFQASLTGARSGATLTGTWLSAHCGRVWFDVSGWAPFELTYDSGTNTLTDNSPTPITWYRP